MRSGKLIDISRSSLISLKAELTRKQEEIQKVKEQSSYSKLPPKPKKEIKSNPGVEQRNEKDIALTDEEVDMLKRSREVLEIKASIYDKYQKGELVSKDGKAHYLVDFSRKSPEPQSSMQTDVERPSTTSTASLANIDTSAEETQKATDISDDPNEDFDIDGDEWVEYVDCLGRTRTCHRSDLSLMKDRDKSLALQLNVEKEDSKQNRQIITENNLEDSNLAEEKELLSRDMHLEQLRKKWEEQEKDLADKQDVHYEDVLFDEARSHGVGYWAFSTDAEKRAAEQEMFKRVRAETEKRQQEAAALRTRREDQRQARLIAARERQRVRLGLPPISTEDIRTSEEAESAGPSSLKEYEPEEDEKADDLQRKLMRAAHVRPWDVGKDGVREPVMTQEEWIEKKRSERIEEFAPLQIQPTSTKSNVKQRQIGLPKKKLIPKQRNTSNSGEKVNVGEMDISTQARNLILRNEAIYGESRGLGVEIPPPPEADTPGPSMKRKVTNIEETAAAIEAGLKYLREEHEKFQNAPTRGTYNMI